MKKEYQLTGTYNNIESLCNSNEVLAIKNELLQGAVTDYVIISRIGNRYDLNGCEITDFVKNPFIKKVEEENMKYLEIEKLIDEEIKKEVEKVKIEYAQEIVKIKAEHEQELTVLKQNHAVDIVNAKETAKAELIAKLNS